MNAFIILHHPLPCSFLGLHSICVVTRQLLSVLIMFHTGFWVLTLFLLLFTLTECEWILFPFYGIIFFQPSKLRFGTAFKLQVFWSEGTLVGDRSTQLGLRTSCLLDLLDTALKDLYQSSLYPTRVCWTLMSKQTFQLPPSPLSSPKIYLSCLSPTGTWVWDHWYHEFLCGEVFLVFEILRPSHQQVFATLSPSTWNAPTLSFPACNHLNPISY